MPYVKIKPSYGRYGVMDWLGDDQQPSTASKLKDALTSDTASTIAGIGLVFHGYKRTGSVLWALIYGLAGREVPLLAVPVAVAQGFGQRKACP